MTLDMKWLNGIDPGKQKDFEQYLRNSAPLFSKLSEILSGLDQQAQRTSKADYDSPSWAYKQADNNGYRRAIQEITKLISL